MSGTTYGWEDLIALERADRDGYLRNDYEPTNIGQWRADGTRWPDGATNAPVTVATSGTER